MLCSACRRGETDSGTTTVTLKRGGDDPQVGGEIRADRGLAWPISTICSGS
jgi:hypothetical protein